MQWQWMRTGQVYDPYGGQKILIRKSTPCFRCIYRRSLTCATCCSLRCSLCLRYGFEIAEETLQLMKRIANSGELDALTPERVWKKHHVH